MCTLNPQIHHLFFTDLETVITFTQHCTPQKPNYHECSLNKTRAIYSLYNLA